mmetsp:Transcript_12269/g.25507  ORF Transcript_12269/g.25507 Transcript_12269/m.25507 type:complete len:96 (+) Transcript_12269:41-328(+)
MGIQRPEESKICPKRAIMAFLCVSSVLNPLLNLLIAKSCSYLILDPTIVLRTVRLLLQKVWPRQTQVQSFREPNIPNCTHCQSGSKHTMILLAKY